MLRSVMLTLAFVVLAGCAQRSKPAPELSPAVQAMAPTWLAEPGQDPQVCRYSFEPGKHSRMRVIWKNESKYVDDSAALADQPLSEPEITMAFLDLSVDTVHAGGSATLTGALTPQLLLKMWPDQPEAFSRLAESGFESDMATHFWVEVDPLGRVIQFGRDAQPMGLAADQAEQQLELAMLATGLSLPTMPVHAVGLQGSWRAPRVMYIDGVEFGQCHTARVERALGGVIWVSSTPCEDGTGEMRALSTEELTGVSGRVRDSTLTYDFVFDPASLAQSSTLIRSFVIDASVDDDGTGLPTEPVRVQMSTIVQHDGARFAAEPAIE